MAKRHRLIRSGWRGVGSIFLRVPPEIHRRTIRALEAQLEHEEPDPQDRGRGTNDEDWRERAYGDRNDD